MSTLADLLRAAAADAPDVVALSCDGQDLTYRELAATIGRAAQAWHQHGLRPDDRVAVWADNSLDCALVMLSVIVAGGILVPLNPRYTVAEVAAILPRAACRYIAAASSAGGRTLAADVVGVAGGAEVVTLAGSPAPGTIGWHELLSRADDAPLPHRSSELAAIQFTSGTTGRPKGALLRQAPMLDTARTWSDVVGLRRGDVYPVLYPLAHVGGFKTGVISAFHARATSTLVPQVSSASIVEIVRSGRVAVLNAPPTAQAYVLAARRSGALPGELGIRTAVIGSATVPPALVRGLVEDLGVADVVIGYGLTEATGVCTMTRRGDPLELVSGTIGRPIDGVEVRVNPTGDGAADGVGELEVRGANVMAGYLDDPAATAEAMHDGWLRTGDLGWIGPDGYVRLAGRTRDLVIVGGFNVYPVEIEHALVDHPAVREVAVVGLPDSRLGEVTAAFVVGGGIEPDALLAWCRERLANFKVPRHLWLVDELPRNAMGKIVKTDLARRAAELIQGRDSLD